MEPKEIDLTRIVSVPFEENTFIARIAGREDCVVVDPGLEPEKTIAELEKHALTPTAILLTHGHSDHIGGNRALKDRWPDCPLVIGAKEAGGLQNAIVAALLIVLVAFVLRAAFSVEADNLRPLVPPEIGMSGFLLVTPVLFVTFMGFAEIAAVSEEIKNPDRNLPLAVIGSVVVVTVVYCVVEFCVVGLRRYDDPSMASETVLMEIARMLMGQVGYALILLGGILATVSSANASIMAASRISFAMGRDGLMPEWFNEIHRRPDR